jgi:hypothetical protein
MAEKLYELNEGEEESSSEDDNEIDEDNITPGV